MNFQGVNEIRFITACEKGQLNEAKMLLVEHPEINVYHGFYCAFRSTCRYGHLHVAKWLVETFPNINIHAGAEYAFRYACENGHFEVAKWLTSDATVAQCVGGAGAHAQCVGGAGVGIDIHACNEDAFRSACTHGHLELAKWLLEFGTGGTKPIDVRALDCDAFSSSCERGHLDVAKWLASIDAVSVDVIEKTFTKCCRSSELEVLKWLVETYPTLVRIKKTEHLLLSFSQRDPKFAKWLLTICPSVKDIVSDLDKYYLFITVCDHGWLDNAKLFVSTFPDFDVHQNNDDLYKRIMAQKNLSMIRWFLETYPETKV